MNLLIIVLTVICNFILYLSFGSLLTLPVGKKKCDNQYPLSLKIIVGFFFYYFVFFFVCILPMKNYRPLSMLTKIWVPLALGIVLLSSALNFREWIARKKVIITYIKEHKLSAFILVLLIGLYVISVSIFYNFTLDAAYYVANVATSVETDMMNVYDPFTGAWQDHYEMRYFFATYQMQDAVVCQFTGIPALIYTKTIMSITIIILTNMVYLLIAGELFKDSDKKEIKTVIMMAMIFVVNMTFITIYTSSLFLMTRTYEGKAIIGNLALVSLFYFFIRMNDDNLKLRPWIIIFILCFGSATISSSANMLIPVELTILFLPMIIGKKQWKSLPGYVLCVIPGLAFSLIYILYVKGYFVWYTFPK
ncbi:MAG: hypothetical protein K6E98_12205 [Lachnospiraceae bacterium]|nr:hypothetical protein [Lachnospiraceae bacterium]